jgi:N-acetylglucosamine kinase-like BadF-type ATPase
MRVIGLDSGGTKTVCYLATGDLQVLAESRGPGAHPTAAGVRGVETILNDVIGRVLADSPGEIDSICLGMAGVDRPGETTLIRTIVDRIVKARTVTVVNDALVALEAGAPGLPGVVLISGTGSIAYGRSAEGNAARAGGWGHVLADEGSGYWLGRQALRAVMRESDGRGPATVLTARLLEHYQVTRAQDLVRTVYSGNLKPSAIATLAAIVQAAAAGGDDVASRIIDVGAIELSAAAASVAARLQMTQCTVVLAGGIFRAIPRMREAVIAHLSSRLPGAQIRPLDVEPAMGAVRLALRAAAGESVVPTYLDS